MPIAVDELQRALAVLAARLGTDVERLLKRTGALDQQELLAFLTDAYPELVRPYEAAAGELTAQYYSEQPSTTPDFRAVAAEGAPTEQLAASARWAALQQVPISALQGSAARSVMNASRDTVLGNVAREPGALWVRHASANACGFCRMLATRGAVYRSKASAESVVGRSINLETSDRRQIAAGVITREQALADRSKYRSAKQAGKRGKRVGDARVGALRGTRNMGDKYHDRCHCIAVPIRPGDSYEPPEYVQQWEDDYIAAVKSTKTAGKTKGDYGAIDVKAVSLEMDKIGAKRLAAEQHNAKVARWLDAEDEHRHRVEYWRRVDAEDLHRIPPSERVEPELPQVVESPVDRAARELEEAIATGDDDRIGAAADALERAENAERKAAQAAERKARKANEQADEIVGLIEQGWEPAEAESHITGKSVESIRRRDFITQARTEGHTGAGFDDLISSVHNERVNEMYLAAESATNGYMVKRAYELKVSPKMLWSVNDATARKWMSDEMAAWFDENGRLTRPILRQMVLDGSYSIGRFTSQGQDYLQ